MAGKKRVPKRRFEGFTGEWKERKLGELGLFGKTYSYSRAHEGSGEYHHIHYGDIHSRFNGIIDKNTLVPSINVKGNYELLDNGDIVIADASEDYEDLGKTVVIEDLDNRWIIAGLHTFKFTPNDYLNPFFYLYYSQTHLFKKFIYKTGTGISVFGISKENINEMMLNIPSIPEQQKIGNFFKKLDEVISLQQRKLEKTKALKSAYLAEMFPSEGERVPKRRFEGFTDEWEVRKLVDIAPLRGGFAFKSSEFKEEGIPIIRISNILSNGSVGGDFVFYQEQENDADYLLPDKAAVIAMSGATTGKVSIIDNPDNQKIYQNQRVGYFRKKQNVDYSFISTLVTSRLFTDQLKSVLVAGAQPNISANEIDSFEFLIPTQIDEQNKIGNFFKQIDKVIANNQRKLDKLKALKQAYLHEMFV